MKAMEKIQRRRSVRSYDPRPVEPEIKERLRQLFQEHNTGPFGTAVRFALLDFEELDPREIKSLGTYGMVRGARLYILAAVKDVPGSQLDLGYCLEKIILEATAMGLGTCWLGGTFRRSSFARQMGLAEDELMPAVTPVGYPAESAALQDRVARVGARSTQRKPWSELFFSADGKTPLTENEAGAYRDALEAVRLGPSAKNRQPWRIVRDEKGRYHLYLKEDRIINRAFGKIRLQHLDMGIAMAHFELAAREWGIEGRWEPRAAAVPLPGLEHIALWEE